MGNIKQNICTSLVLPHSNNDEKYEVYEHAFRGCKNLLSIEIPSDVSKLNYRSFENCRLLINFVIEPGVKYIGWDVFDGAISLKKIKYKGNILDWKSINIEKHWSTHFDPALSDPYDPTLRPPFETLVCIECLDGEIKL